MNKTTTIVITAVIALALGLIGGSAMGKHDMRRMDRMDGPGGERMMGDMRNVSGSMPVDMDMAGTMRGMTMSLDGKTGDAFDQTFLAEMIVHHQGAVEMAQLALTNAKHQEIKDLAKNIIDAQNKEIADMKKWQANWYPQQ